ncbi:hypothetical protein ACQP25_35975 [Microtetraspora malaysiensis]|uniref:hypothetical protein n=1 Tax=Microtetraspora malaysiensis TaxID=161358 RepID=UPI003D902C44
MWSVVNDSDRAQWGYVPFENVGPLRFGMSPEEAAAAMDAQGFTGCDFPMHPHHGALVQRTDFRAATAQPYVIAVTVYYGNPGGLACVAVDALCGPQVSMERMRLVGQVPSELTHQFHRYVEERDMGAAFSVEGDAVSDELGIMMRAQRAGDVLLSRPFFARFHDWAYTMHDSVPTDEWDVR